MSLPMIYQPVASPLRSLFVAVALASAAFAGEPQRKPAAPNWDLLLPRQGQSQSVPQLGVGGKARTGMFGVTGEGYKFVYCLDRSGSMGGSGQRALRAVKAELLASLRNLDTVHQFQIVFYNERPVVFNPTGVPGRLAFANQQNKDRVERFLDAITADGGTNHEQALRTAIALHPDVIFFLTDADQPRLTPAEITKISQLAAGITINAIEFGPGPQPAAESFLAALARENAGQYAYVDLTKLATAAEKPGR